jgi:hypothetical protein
MPEKPFFKVSIYWILASAFAISACTVEASSPTPEPTPAPSATAEPDPSPTTIWFPPTPTYTPFPTAEVSPTAEIDLGVGPILFEDHFDDPSLWESPPSAAGSASLANGEMAIVVTVPDGFYYSLRREPVIGDFYLEVTASPAICKGLDEYGVMLRAASEGDYYRFSFSCDGQVRLDRIFHGGAAALMSWTPGAGVPPGPPSSVRMGVWMRGEEMSFYANDLFQFSMHDPMLLTGRVGLFARSANETAVTVGFSDLVVHQLEGSE